MKWTESETIFLLIAAAHSNPFYVKWLNFLSFECNKKKRKKLIDGWYKKATKLLSHCTAAECGSGRTPSLRNDLSFVWLLWIPHWWSLYFPLQHTINLTRLIYIYIFTCLHFSCLPKAFYLEEQEMVLPQKHSEDKIRVQIIIFPEVNQPEWIKPVKMNGMPNISPSRKNKYS